MSAPLRIVFCGSVDDGKSTLIGRLLTDTGSVPADQLDAIGGDLARLTDGLAAEREQGITIDVAYRHLALPGRRALLADAPGHEAYTRNMATAASTADTAVILVDARAGVLRQTRRHTRILALMGVRHAILAVNKMDLAGHDRARFDAIAADFAAFAAPLGLAATAVPVVATRGDNVLHPSPAMPWHAGPTLAQALAAAPAGAGWDETAPFRMPVQYVARSRDDRLLAGRVVAGIARPGDTVLIAPANRTARVAGVISPHGDVAAAHAGQSAMLVLDGHEDVGRGAVLSSAADPIAAADQLEAALIWFADEPLIPGRAYWARLATALVPAQITELKHRVDPDSGDRLAAKQLALNEIGAVKLALAAPAAFAPYAENRHLGGFILVDRRTNATVGAGMIRHALTRADTVRAQVLDVTKAARARLNAQTPRALWFTGLSGAGKSTIANLVERELHALGRHTYILDGDNIRLGLNRDLGFTEADRAQNIRRVAEVARLMVDAGLIVLVSFISPFRAERRAARERFEPGEFWEVHVDTPLADAERRDVKGLYARARAGEIANFTGISQPYEPPETPEIRVDTTAESAEAAATRIVAMLERAP